MKEIRTSGPLMFSDPNCPTRVGEIINTISEIYDIPNPSEGMQVYVRDEKKTYTITGLKEAVIGGERVPDAKVDTFEAVKSQVEEIDNDLAEMQEALINGSFVVGIANAVKAGAVTFEMLDGKLQLSASVVDDLETDDALKPLSANQGKVLKELIDIINGTGEGSTDKKITDAIAKLVDNAPENLDTLKELAEWIKDHGTEVAEMLAAINANATAIKTEAERATEAENNIKATAISKEAFEAFATSSTLELGCKTLAGEEFIVELPPATTKLAGVMSAEDKVKLNASIKNVDVAPSTDDVELDLEDNTDKTTHVVFPAATTESAGVMSAEDKKALDSLETAIAEGEKRVLRRLFVAAGATYNKGTGFYELNGITDLTESDMANIYAYKEYIGYINMPRVMQRNSSVRTLYPLQAQVLQEKQIFQDRQINTTSTFYGSALEVIKFTSLAQLNTTVLNNIIDMRNTTETYGVFGNCSKLRIIYPINVMGVAKFSNDMFSGCVQLEEVRLFKIKATVSFADSSLISKESVLYMITNAAPTSAITITLHADAYARLANDADIVAALEAQPLITLVSA